MKVDELNAKDIYELFSSLYKEKHNLEYQGFGWIGNEMHSLRNILDEYGSAQVACSVLNCIINNDSTVTIPYFAAGIKYYLTDIDPKLYWSIMSSPNPSVKKKWRAFTILNSKWLPTATDQKRLASLEKELQEIFNEA